MSAYSGKSGFKQALEKGTSSQLEEPDWDAIIAICDLVRSGDIKAPFAIENIMKKISQDNPATAKYALQILESVVKNCGPKVHSEVATPHFMEFMKKQSKLKTDSVKAKILELIQCWAHAFRDNDEYKAVGETFNEMKNSGVSFPTLKEVDAMFTSEVPPDWKESTSCYSCRTEFGMITRRHHCRACGQSYCGKCSSKSSMIPKFGIEKEVRVCDSCYTKLNPGSSSGSAGKNDDSELPAEYLNSPLYKQSLKEGQGPSDGPPAEKSKQEAEEEDQLQLALAISQSEAEAKEQEKKRRQTYMSLDAKPPGFTTDTPVVQPAGPKIELDKDLVTPELQKYFDRGYWEQKEKDNIAATVSGQPPQQVKAAEPPKAVVASVTTPSAPPPTQSEPSYTNTANYTEMEGYQNGVDETQPEEDEEKREQFMKDMSSSIDVFVNRMNSNSARGRNIINDSSVQTLFAALQSMNPQLLNYIQALEDKRSTYEGLQDKLAQLRDARDALDSLKQEHEEKRRIEAQEKAKRKQIQMMQKLDILRKQKQQVLDRQRLAAIQKMEQQESEMRARMEMQKQQTQMRQMQLHGFSQELQAGYGHYNTMMAPGDYQHISQYGNPHMTAPGMAIHQQHPMHPPYQQPIDGTQSMMAQQGQIVQPGYQPEQYGPAANQQGYGGTYQPMTGQMQPGMGPQQAPGQTMQHVMGQPPLPGQPQLASQQVVPGQQQVPGQPQQYPGQQQQVPGQQQQVPGQQQQVPGQQQQVPGQQYPGQQPQVPAQQPPVPGQQPQVPGQQPQVPGQQPQVPGQQPQVPGQQPQVPGQQPQVPGQQPQVPGQQQPYMNSQMGYNPYGMQGMAEALPAGGQPPVYQTQANHQLPTQYQAQQTSVSDQQGYGQNTYQQYQPPPDDSQLISFD